MSTQDARNTQNDQLNAAELAMQEAERLVAHLRSAPEADREAIKAEMLALATGSFGSRIRDHLEILAKGELLEIQWEIEEVVEEATPKKAAAPAPKPDPKAAAKAPAKEEPKNKKLTAADLQVMYDDPRGLILHKTKVGDRWFATQVDPRSGQPQTFELHASEVSQLKMQLMGSPYWVTGGV
jgi:hypothetical protein